MPRAKKPKHSLPEDFYEIMERGDSEEIKAVFQDEEMLKFLTQSKEETDNPLFIYSPCTEIYKWFVKQGFDINMEGIYGKPIHEHARRFKNNIEGIILAGADIEEKYHDYTPLKIAAEVMQPSSMRVLIKYGADIHITRGRGEGLLDVVIDACMHKLGIGQLNLKAFECMELLINAGLEAEDRMKDDIFDICIEFDRRKDTFIPYQNDPQP